MIQPTRHHAFATVYRARSVVVLLLGGMLAACETYPPAPVVEQSAQQQVQAPEIISSGGSSTSAPRGSISSVSRATPAAAERANTHRVRRGDTLYSIAFQYDLDFRSLAIANNLSPPYTILVDQVLNLDASRPVSTTPVPPPTTSGTVVSNNRVASARAAETTTTTNVIRRSIEAPRSGEPQWRWPMQGPILRNFQATSGADKGIDIGGVAGQPVYAAADGDVVYAGNTIQGSGNLIILRHNDRYLSAYAMNRTLLVSEGARIRAGDTIAEMGQGPDGVPKLHFEIRLDGKPVDPLRFLPRQ
ncbi:MAG: hypothetical protein RLZZ385_643 [Pseudomonadota bacterium]|jgi:lipoprotein NlpD